LFQVALRNGWPTLCERMLALSKVGTDDVAHQDLVSYQLRVAVTTLARYEVVRG